VSASEREITEKIASLCKSRSELWAKEKAQKLREAVLRNPFQKNLYQRHLFNLEMLVKFVLQYQEHQFTYSYSVIQNITMLKNEL
jgi:transposase